MKLVAQIGGTPHGAELSGARAFIGLGPRLVVLDLSDPAAPRELSRTPPLPDLVRDVAATKNHALVAARGAGLIIFDVSNPSSPRRVGAFPTKGEAAGVEVVGDRAFLGDERAGLLVLDISDPASPRELGRFQGDPNPASNPANIPEFRDIQVTVEGSRAYVTYRPRGLAGKVGINVLDLSEPQNPRRVAFVKTDLYPLRLSAAQGRLACYQDVAGAVDFFDLTSEGEAPSKASRLEAAGVAGVALDGERALVLDEAGGLKILDTSEIEAPRELQTHPRLLKGMNAQELAVVGDTLSVGGPSGLHVVDLSDPAQPREVGWAETRGSVSAVSASKGLALLSAEPLKLFLIDLSDPGSPSVRSEIEAPRYAKVEVGEGAHAWVTASEEGLKLLDLSDPASPAFRSGFNPEGLKVGALDLVGDLACLVTNLSKLTLVDVSAPERPSLVGELAIPDYPTRVTADGTLAYVSAKALHVIDISTPSAPREVGSFEAPGFIGAFALGGEGRGYLGNGERGVRALDLSNPAEPREVGFYEPPFAVGSVVATESLVLVPGDEQGVLIIRDLSR